MNKLRGLAPVSFSFRQSLRRGSVPARRTALSRAGTRGAGTGAPASDWSEWKF